MVSPDFQWHCDFNICNDRLVKNSESFREAHGWLARLPLPQIIRLRCVSKEWLRNVMSAEEDSFRRACAEANPKYFGLIHREKDTFGIAICDVKANEWYKFAKKPSDRFIKLCASDGRLVCIIWSPARDDPFRLITVCNPLTRLWTALPPLCSSSDRPLMLQLLMKRDTKCYEVLVVYRKDIDLDAMVYSSMTGEWSSSFTTFFRVINAAWDFATYPPLVESYCIGPSTFIERKFQSQDPAHARQGVAFKGRVLVGNCLFELHENMDAENDL